MPERRAVNPSLSDMLAQFEPRAEYRKYKLLRGCKVRTLIKPRIADRRLERCRILPHDRIDRINIEPVSQHRPRSVSVERAVVLDF